jgi:hypothetical protein
MVTVNITQRLSIVAMRDASFTNQTSPIQSNRALHRRVILLRPLIHNLHLIQLKPPRIRNPPIRPIRRIRPKVQHRPAARRKRRSRSRTSLEHTRDTASNIKREFSPRRARDAEHYQSQNGHSARRVPEGDEEAVEMLGVHLLARDLILFT